jgi:hypothetical protein
MWSHPQVYQPADLNASKVSLVVHATTTPSQAKKWGSRDTLILAFPNENSRIFDVKTHFFGPILFIFIDLEQLHREGVGVIHASIDRVNVRRNRPGGFFVEESFERLCPEYGKLSAKCAQLGTEVRATSFAGG